jgi:hypothetical protein
VVSGTKNLCHQLDSRCSIATNGDEARKFRCAGGRHRGCICRKLDLVQPAPVWTAISEVEWATANAHPSPMRGLFELLGTFVLAFVIAQLVLRLNSANWKRAVGLGLWLWVGFPVIFLTGSILWQNVPWQLAAIHSGDWLIKLILIPAGIAAWPKRATA